jgi:putative membrane protein
LKTIFAWTDEAEAYSRARRDGQGNGACTPRDYTCSASRSLSMLWLKAFHVIFVVTWFAGLFYLPRLFVYHAEATEPVVRERLKIMQRRLLMITHIGGALTLLFGVLTVIAFAHAGVDYMRQGWLHAKLGLVLLLIVYHLMLVKLVREFALDANRHSSRWLRLFNEVPALLLIGIVLLAVVKP